MGEVGQNGLRYSVLTFAWPSQSKHAGPRIKQEKSQGDAECCICFSSWEFMTLTFWFSGLKKKPPGLCQERRTDTDAKVEEKSYLGPSTLTK